MMITPRTLTEIVKSTGLQYVDLLSLDVEGHELEVLQSWDFSVPIRIILIEMLGVQMEKEEECRKVLREKGYMFIEVYKHNEIWRLPDN